jgi:hypothetical protein
VLNSVLRLCVFFLRFCRRISGFFDFWIIIIILVCCSSSSGLVWFCGCVGRFGFRIETNDLQKKSPCF